MTIEDIADTNNFNGSKNQPAPVQIKVLGVGGGGCNAVNYMYSQGYKDITFAIANTDRQALQGSNVPTQVLLGPKTCGGNGAGAIAEKARAAAEESAAAIEALFNDSTKVVFIAAGMGGGTGTGASPVVARIAKARGILTVCIVTIPFLFEGFEKIKSALAGAEEMSKYVDVMLVVNNERLIDIYPDLDFMNAFHKADETLCNAAKSISDLINMQGYINCDLQDVCTTLRNGGTAIISTGYGTGENRITEAINNSLNSPLLKNKNIFTAKRILICIHFNKDSKRPFKTQEVNQLTQFMSNFTQNKTYIWGVYQDDTLNEEIKVSVLAAGFDTDSNGDYEQDDAAKTEETDAEQEAQKNDGYEQKIIETYGKDATQRFKAERQRFFILAPQQIDDESILELLEQYPAYNRDKTIVDRFKAMAKELVADDSEAEDGELKAGKEINF